MMRYLPTHNLRWRSHIFQHLLNNSKRACFHRPYLLLNWAWLANCFFFWNMPRLANAWYFFWFCFLSRAFLYNKAMHTPSPDIDVCHRNSGGGVHRAMIVFLQLFDCFLGRFDTKGGNVVFAVEPHRSLPSDANSRSAKCAWVYTTFSSVWGARASTRPRDMAAFYHFSNSAFIGCSIKLPS